MLTETKADAYQRTEAILEEGPFVLAWGGCVHRAYSFTHQMVASSARISR